MKFLALLFFVTTIPAFLFLTIILYSSSLNTILKEQFIKASVYDQISKNISSIESDDAESQIVNIFIEKYTTPTYIQSKAESTIDESYDWITGKSTTIPVLSFKDVKDDLTTKYPRLFSSVEEMAKEVKDQQSQQPDGSSDSSSDQQSNADTTKSIDSIVALAKSDFSIPLNKYLIGVKTFYSALKIDQPILAALLIFSLALIGFLCKSWSSRFKWIGATLMISAINGFLIIFFNSYLISALSTLATNMGDNKIAAIVSPIVLQIVKHFVDEYLTYQGITSVAFLIIAAGLFAAAALTKNTPKVLPKVVKKK